jgi:hypothetical protein
MAMPPWTCVLRLALVAAGGSGLGRVPHGGGGQLGGHGHVGAVVLDRLEHADDPPELHPLLGVGRGRVGAGAGQADCFGRQDQPSEIGEHLRAARDDRGWCPVEDDAS